MNQWIRNVLTSTAVAVMLTGVVGASDFTHCADVMKNMELFAGTPKGYELDRTPTRAEAAVMLVRLLGQEDTAIAGDYDMPFTDVPDWAQPYIGWLYENDLTEGMSATKFGTNMLCSAQQYATFLLRALGYADGDGYTYDTALEYATQYGVIDDVNCDTQNFLRDHVVAMSYTALAQPTKAGQATLLDALIEQGSVRADKAQTVLETFHNLQNYERARLQTISQDAQAYDLTATITDSQYNTVTYSGKIDQQGKELSAQLEQQGQTIFALYINDGVVYRYTGQKVEIVDNPIQRSKIPVSAVLTATTKEDTFALSFAPTVLNRMTQSSEISLRQADYSVRLADDGTFRQQIGRIYVRLPGLQDTYTIEIAAERATREPEIDIPDEIEI